MQIRRQLAKMTTLGILLTHLPAQSVEENQYPKIYPFVPLETQQIFKSVERMSEDPEYLHNFNQIISQKLAHTGHTFKTEQGKKKKFQPWGSTYWPLNRGLIADPYNDSVFGAYNPLRIFSWEHNRNRYLKRSRDVHQKIDTLNSKELADLAPSEKYDLLLGDKSFHLTNKIWSYMQAWGSMKEYGMLHSLDKVGGKSIQRAEEMLGMGWYSDREKAITDAVKMRGGLAEKIAQKMITQGIYNSIEEALPEAIGIAEQEKDNYVIKKKNAYMATWEGICHGWSTASGIYPRPKKSVSFNLEDGRKLKFYPEDIKGLVSYLWANSLIQDNRWFDEKGNPHGGGILMQGLRCNEKSPKKDEWGRYYDHRPDFFSGKLEPRCVGVHPAIWHMGLINIMGKQGRSFIVERKIKAAVDNHPLSQYKMEYFNPYTGKYTNDPNQAVQPLSDEDQFRAFRSKETRYIVGVKTTMVYLDWQRPKREEVNSEKDDKLEEKEMMYDLELDSDKNIIGGQWRAHEVGKPRRPNHKQPDFFWVVTKDWKNWFQDMKGLDTWIDTSKTPPKSWKKVAKGAHDFLYQKTFDFGFNEQCEVIHRKTNEVVKVPCEYKVSQPQPLINVVNKLIELSQ